MKKLLYSLIFALLLSGTVPASAKTADEQPPRIVNIINFIRATEPRIDWITDDVLYGTVVDQLDMMQEYSLKGTFLLQYDALVIPRYQQLMKKALEGGCEIGGWWELTQPHVEAAGLKWRGRYSWDWHANVGFATGYTPREREKLVDAYMQKFKEIFGAYPKSIGSWFIDAHTLAYMAEKYGVIASCNCKDQIGTDGYTLWGGYWNQAYYPSRVNAYMPAQTEKGQIPVPVFRMLGSDPIYQYESGIGGARQTVVSLEPVYTKGGGSQEWVEWFFHSMFKEPTLNFSYVQAGQENSFTWKRIKRGFDIQIPLLKKLLDEKAIRIETLAESGAWFKQNFRTTPATAVTTMNDHKGEGRKTVWFNSRHYRANLLWHNDAFKIRDIHIFDEDVASDYIKTAGTSTSCIYHTLPFVDGCLWSSKDFYAGLRIRIKDGNGQLKEALGGTPEVDTEKKDELNLTWRLEDGTTDFGFRFTEDKMYIECSDKTLEWEMELTSETGKELPFKKISESRIDATYRNSDYHILSCKGQFGSAKKGDVHSVLTIRPDRNKIILQFNQK